MATLTHYYRELLHYFSRSLRDRERAGDLVQETYARVLAAERSGQAIAEPRALLYRTARNLLIDQQRREDLRQHDGEACLAEMPVPAAEQPEEIYAATQRAHRLVEVIDKLPPRCREAFVLHKLEGLPQAEVAERMGISRNMVERHVMLGVLACRNSLAADDMPTAPTAFQDPSR